MFDSVLEWIAEINGKFDINPRRVLDIGSLDRNLEIGARKQFPDSEYIGIDIAYGSNVDMVLSVYELDKQFDPGSFDAVLGLHLFEHLARPWEALDQIKRILPVGGYFYLSIPTLGFPRHNYPSDYWRATTAAVSEVFMDGYNILSLRDDHSKFSKHPFINCLGVKMDGDDEKDIA
jgi:SAM-dependent methyltransferase